MPDFVSDWEEREYKIKPKLKQTCISQGLNPERLKLEKASQKHGPVSKQQSARFCWCIQHHHVKFLTLINQGHRQTSPFKNFMKEAAVHFSLWSLSLGIQMLPGSSQASFHRDFSPEQLALFSVICCLHQDPGRIFFNTLRFVSSWEDATTSGSKWRRGVYWRWTHYLFAYKF